MLLIKCKCGCRFTLSETRERKHYICCPDCEKRLPIDNETFSVDLGGLLDSVESVSKIPDGAKIEISFNV